MKPPFLKALDFSEEDFGNALLELRIHVTRECNLRCSYCLSNAPFVGEKRWPCREELTLEELKGAVAQAKSLGAKTVAVTGSGEPLLYANLKELVAHISGLGLRTVVFTNGLLLTPELAQFFYESGTNLILKLNSLEPRVNDRLVGMDGAQKIFLEKIGMLVEMGFAKEGRLGINSIICRENYDGIPELFVFCRKNGIIPWIEAVTITGRAKQGMAVPEEKIRELYRRISEIDGKSFGFDWEPDSVIIGADRRRYSHVCQVNVFGDVYPTDANITDEVGNIRGRSLSELMASEKFKALRSRDKHSRSFFGGERLGEKIYGVLTCRKFRAGPLPAGRAKELVVGKIEQRVSKNLPVELFLFWGGCKNPNLPVSSADLCEEATLASLCRLGSEVKKVYPPGLKVFICPGDARVEKVNRVPHERTEKYVESLEKIAESYGSLFAIVPVSGLYRKYAGDFEAALHEAESTISCEIESHPDFGKLVANARKNFFGPEKERMARSAARDYVICRVAEEEARIFREFDDCIRSFFIRYTPFYRQYIGKLDETTPHLDCSLVFFTGGKGNVTQPWQAVGKKGEGRIVFLSQERLAKALAHPARITS